MNGEPQPRLHVDPYGLFSSRDWSTLTGAPKVFLLLQLRPHIGITGSYGINPHGPSMMLLYRLIERHVAVPVPGDPRPALLIEAGSTQRLPNPSAPFASGHTLPPSSSVRQNCGAHPSDSSAKADRRSLPSSSRGAPREGPRPAVTQGGTAGSPAVPAFPRSPVPPFPPSVLPPPSWYPDIPASRHPPCATVGGDASKNRSIRTKRAAPLFSHLRPPTCPPAAERAGAHGLHARRAPRLP